MRVIDADDLLKQKPFTYIGWQVNSYCAGFLDCAQEAREAVNNAPTLTPPTEWVSVKDRLPEECADILLCRKILKIPEIGTYRQARFWVYDEIGDVYQVDDITHWLPIPTPYDIEHIHISEPSEG